MKARILAPLLALSLLLSGCAALLDRPYAVVEPHAEHPVTGEDPSTLRAGNYSELVSAVLYLVSQCMEEGLIQLVDYEGDVGADLNAACLEVAAEDPLGAYAVEFIKNEYTRILSSYEAHIDISYRRAPEQIRSLVNVTGTTAIRQEMGDALTDFVPELALRVGYFTGNERSIADLIRQAYYDTPAAALGMPEFTVALYPDQGSQRVVEIILTYPQEPEALRRKSAELLEAAEAALIPLRDQQFSQRRRTEQLLELLPEVIRWNGSPHEDGSPRNTAWDALVGEGANQEGLALAFRLLCDQLNLECAVIQGSWNGAPHFWNTLILNGEAWFVDLTLEDYAHLRTGEELALLGYDWSGRPEVSPTSGGGVGEIARNLKNNT